MGKKIDKDTKKLLDELTKERDKQTKNIKSMPKNTSKRVSGKGTEILACLNIDYQVFLEKLVDELMSHPDSNYTLFLQKAAT